MNSIDSRQEARLYIPGESLQSQGANSCISPSFSSPSFKPFVPESGKVKKSLKEYLITVLDDTEIKLDELIPNFKIQRDFDAILEEIQSESKLVRKFTEWLNDNGHNAWYGKLATYLVKLPIKVAFNLVHLIFNYIKLAIGAPAYAIMHPLKVPIKLSKIFIELVHALLQPETWTKIGGSLVGSSCAHAAITGGVPSVIFFGLGAAMMIGGIPIGTLKTALYAENGKRWSESKSFVANQLKQAPENVLTGFCLVMFIEGIHQFIRGFQALAREVRFSGDWSSSRKNFGDNKIFELYKKITLPRYERINYTDRYVSISWHHRHFDRFRLPINFPGGTYFTENVHTHDVYSQVDIYNPSTELYETVTITNPVYEEFCGYRIPMTGWIPPIKPPMPDPIRLNDQIIPALGLTTSNLNEKQWTKSAIRETFA